MRRWTTRSGKTVRVTSRRALVLRWAAVMVLMLVAAAGMGGCSGDDEPGAGAAEEPVDLPDWIEGVHPDPGASASPTPEVQVLHGVVGAREGVRLLVDGTDVTQYAGDRPGVLSYDPDAPRAPVDLGPGTHQASAVRVLLDEFGDQHEVLDQFEWRFTIQ